MADEFYRTSNLTGRTYNFFETVKIKNMNQAAAYIENDVFPIDVRAGREENGKRVIMFYFDKQESKEVFDKWCNYELN